MTRPSITSVGRRAVIALFASGLIGSSPGLCDAAPAPHRAILDQYCVTCHNERLRTAKLALDSPNLDQVSASPELWEKVVTKLRTRTMPPTGRPRPDAAAYESLAGWLESELDRASAANPNPGRTATFHRLNRAEYQNAIRDLLGLDVDVAALLPGDDIDEEGFDNMAEILTVSPALLERYLAAARKTARLAVGRAPLTASVESYKLPILLQQDDRMSDDLPFGSRGGLAVRHQFPLDGEYEIKITLHRNYVNYVRGLGTRQELDVRLDGVLVKRFAVGGETHGKTAPASYAGNIFGNPEWEKYALNADAGLKVRATIKAGPHVVGVSFLRQLAAPEGVEQPRQTVFAVAINDMRDGNAAVEEVAVAGPYKAVDPGDTPSRRRIFVCRPGATADAIGEKACARTIVSALARRAYRRQVSPADVDTLLRFYDTGRTEGSFDAGIQLALERLLIAPDFLFRVERDPANTAPASPYRLDGFALASRLSFFLWSGIPDEELLALAEQHKLGDPAVLERQVRRMLADPRSAALVDNFAAEWLRLRSLKGIVPDPVVFPEFDENLRDAFRQETELFVGSNIRENRSVLELLSANYTFVNERLAQHYGMPNIYGSHFRRVTLDSARAAQRGGLFGQGSMLTVTSYPNRTSPVLRGKWVLTNILGTPPPPPPADVPGLPESGEDGKPATVRDRMERHRRNAVCATCHAPMDPLGLALESYDAIGRWRTLGETRQPIDTSGALPDGSRFEGPTGLRELLLERKEQFVGTLAEKLLSYALGRRAEAYDRPVIRQIVRESASENYRWSAIILGIVKSTPFQMRRAAS